MSFQQHSLQVITNGVIFFETAIARFGVTEFSPVDMNYPMITPFIAPYWIDNDASTKGVVSYEVITGTNDRLNQVNDFISNSENVDFRGTWMLLAEWLNVPQFGSNDTVSNQLWPVLHCSLHV